MSRSSFNVGTKSSMSCVHDGAGHKTEVCKFFKSMSVSECKDKLKSQVDVSGILVATNELNARRTLHVLHAAEPFTIH